MSEAKPLFNLNDQQQFERLSVLSKEDLIGAVKNAVGQIDHLIKRVHFLESRLGVVSQEVMDLGLDQYVLKRDFGPSTEKRESKKKERHQSGNKDRKPKVGRPSERWPELDMVNENIDFKSRPSCKCCGEEMKKMNQREIAETIECVPRRFFIKRTMREKYTCGNCQSSIQTAAVVPRITPGGQYSDDFAIEVAANKYADHLPIERQVRQMSREGLVGIERQTLLAQTHALADYLRCVYRNLKYEVQSLRILQADETPWKMLEGHERKNWYLWGYFGLRVAFYKPYPGRTKDAANLILKDCRAEYLVVDGYTSYNEPSRRAGIKIAHCWAHARRYFFNAKERHAVAEEMLDLIGELYHVESTIKFDPFEKRQAVRSTKGKEIVDKIRDWIFEHHTLGSTSLGEAIDYMKKYWEGLTRFLEDADIPLDNNLSERSLRGAVVGRKTYYGNHSERGAETTAILLSICESCRLNGLDPKKYLKYAVETKHRGGAPLTPSEYAKGNT